MNERISFAGALLVSSDSMYSRRRSFSVVSTSNDQLSLPTFIDTISNGTAASRLIAASGGLMIAKAIGRRQRSES